MDPTLNRELDPLDALDDLRLRIEVFQYEQRLVEKGTRRSMSQVVRAIDAGELTDDAESNPIYYLTFELAECDLREIFTILKKNGIEGLNSPRYLSHSFIYGYQSFPSACSRQQESAQTLTPAYRHPQPKQLPLR